MHPRSLASSRSARTGSLICVCLLSLFLVPTVSAEWLSPGEPEPTPQGFDGAPDDPDVPDEPTPEPEQPDAPAEEPTPLPPPPPNGVPQIDGTPPTVVYAEDRYAFTPAARDPDGDGLTFSIADKPAWAAFDARTGTLAGTPTDADVGDYTGILISVTDGKDTASLGPFTILVRPARTGSVSLSWQPPTQREDGSALTNLAGYRLFYGRQSGEYTQEIPIANPGITRYVVDGLTTGNWYFAMTALDSDGLESDYSEETVRIVRP